MLVSGLWKKTHQVVWDSLLHYGRLNWQQTLHDLEKAPDVAYENVLNEFDIICCVKGLIITRNNLSVTWKVRPQVDIISWVPLVLSWVSQGDMHFSFAIEFVFNLCQQKRRERIRFWIGLNWYCCRAFWEISLRPLGVNYALVYVYYAVEWGWTRVMHTWRCSVCPFPWRPP